MKVFLALPFLFLLASCEKSRPLTVESLLAKAATLNQQQVRVCGLLSDNIEYCGLENDVLQFRGAVDDRGKKIYEVGAFVWVHAGHDQCMPNNKDAMTGISNKQSWAIVEGTFMTGGKFGHLGANSSQIVARKIQLLRESCRGSSQGT